jgi:hypothetical protein
MGLSAGFCAVATKEDKRLKAKRYVLNIVRFISA